MQHTLQSLSAVTDAGAPPRLLYRPVYEGIRELLFSGALGPGTRLEEDVLSKAFHVSRTPLRQALNRLSHDGLAVMVPHRGTFVVDFTKSEILNILEVREGLEGFAARLAAQRIKPKKVLDMRELVATAEASGDPHRIALADTIFHQMVYDSSGNPKLIETAGRINDQIHLLRLTTILLGRRLEESLDETWRIIEAIEGGDGDIAELLARRHVQNAHRAVAANFSEGTTLKGFTAKLLGQNGEVKSGT